MIVKTIVTCCLSRLFMVNVTCAIGERYGRLERLSPTIIEVIVCRKMQAGVVVFAQVYHAIRATDRLILACNVVGYEVNNYLHTTFVHPLHQGFELFEPVFDVYGQVGRNVVIVGNGVRRSRLSLHNGTVLCGNAIR